MAFHSGSGAGLVQRLVNELPCNDPEFTSRSGGCKNRALHPLQGTVNCCAIFKGLRCGWDIKHNHQIPLQHHISYDFIVFRCDKILILSFNIFIILLMLILMLAFLNIILFSIFILIGL